MAPFVLERYLEDLRDRTAWAPDAPIEDYPGPQLPRPILHRMAHLWALALLDDRFDTLLLPILVIATPLLDHIDFLPREFVEERLNSGACLLFIDGADPEEWPRNQSFFAL
jgi:hypothetical protein